MAIFVYMNAHKEVGAYSISNINDDGFYFRGYCSERSRIITFRHDRVIGYFDDIQLAKDYLANLPNEVYLEFDARINAQRHIKNHNSLNDNITFCFSGFKKDKKAELIKLAEQKELRTVMDMSKSVNFLVIDETSRTVGPRKLARATEYGIQIINETEYLQMLETGEIPS